MSRVIKRFLTTGRFVLPKIVKASLSAMDIGKNVHEYTQLLNESKQIIIGKVR